MVKGELSNSSCNAITFTQLKAEVKKLPFPVSYTVAYLPKAEP